MRELGKKHNDAEFFMNLCPSRTAEVIANMVIVLIYQADYLLFKQLERLEKDFPGDQFWYLDCGEYIIDMLSRI